MKSSMRLSGALTRFDSTPTDIRPPDESDLDWLNEILREIWPKANAALENFVRDDFTPQLRHALGGAFSKAYFRKISLGTSSPEFGPIQVTQFSESHVEVDVKMKYISNVDVLLDDGRAGITLGVSHLAFEGWLIIVLRLIGKTPIIGSFCAHFADTPQIAMQFEGLASIANLVGIEHLVMESVERAVRQKLVLPNTIRRNFTDDLAFSERRHPMLGALRVKVLRARGLAGVNWTALPVDQFTSDPFGCLKFGADIKRTSVRTGTVDPSWVDDPSQYFVVYHFKQGLEIDVQAEGQGWFSSTFLSMLGRLRSVPLSEMLEKWSRRRTGSRSTRLLNSAVLDTSMLNRDALHVNDPLQTPEGRSEIDVEIEWFDLRTRKPNDWDEEGTEPSTLCSLELHDAVGFSVHAIEDPKAQYRWEVLVLGGGKELSKVGQAAAVAYAPRPNIAVAPRLIPVIEKLLHKPEYSDEDIAFFVGVRSSKVIKEYRVALDNYWKNLHRKDDAPQDGYAIKWDDTLRLFVKDDSEVVLSLLDQENRAVAFVGPHTLRELFDKDRVEWYPVSVGHTPRGVRTQQPASGAFSWFTSSKAARDVGDQEKFGNVKLGMAAHRMFLSPNVTGGPRILQERKT